MRMRVKLRDSLFISTRMHSLFHSLSLSHARPSLISLYKFEYNLFNLSNHFIPTPGVIGTPAPAKMLYGGSTGTRERREEALVRHHTRSVYRFNCQKDMHNVACILGIDARIDMIYGRLFPLGKKRLVLRTITPSGKAVETPFTDDGEEELAKLGKVALKQYLIFGLCCYRIVRKKYFEYFAEIVNVNEGYFTFKSKGDKGFGMRSMDVGDLVPSLELPTSNLGILGGTDKSAKFIVLKEPIYTSQRVRFVNDADRHRHEVQNPGAEILDRGHGYAVKTEFAPTSGFMPIYNLYNRRRWVQPITDLTRYNQIRPECDLKHNLPDINEHTAEVLRSLPHPTNRKDNPAQPMEYMFNYAAREISALYGSIEHRTPQARNMLRSMKTYPRHPFQKSGRAYGALVEPSYVPIKETGLDLEKELDRKIEKGLDQLFGHEGSGSQNVQRLRQSDLNDQEYMNNRIVQYATILTDILTDIYRDIFVMNRRRWVSRGRSEASRKARETDKSAEEDGGGENPRQRQPGQGGAGGSSPGAWRGRRRKEKSPTDVYTSGKGRRRSRLSATHNTTRSKLMRWGSSGVDKALGSAGIGLDRKSGDGGGSKSGESDPNGRRVRKAGQRGGRGNGRGALGRGLLLEGDKFAAFDKYSFRVVLKTVPRHPISLVTTVFKENAGAGPKMQAAILSDFLGIDATEMERMGAEMGKQESKESAERTPAPKEKGKKE